MDTTPAYKVFLRNIIEAAKNACRSGSISWISRKDGLWYAADRHIGVYFCVYWRGRTFYANGVRARLDELCRQYGIDPNQSFSAEDVVIDAGANIGEFSVHCKNRGATVYAFEPDPFVFQALSKNLPGGAFRVALFNENREIKFYSSVRQADSSIFEPDQVDEVLKVDARTLDSFVEEQGIRNIALLKCDAEGAEPELLMGAKKSLQITRMVSIDCGAERRGESTEETVRKMLSDAGFSVDPQRRERQIVIGKRQI